MGMGSQQSRRGWTQIRALQWAGGGSVGRQGWAGRWGQGGTQRPSRGRALEPGEKLEGAQAGEPGRDEGVRGAAAGLMPDARLGVGLVGSSGDRDRPVQGPAEPNSSPSMAPTAALSATPPRKCRGVFRPLQSAPFATKGPQTPGSLPGQAGVQARCRVAASALALASRTVASS